ncbi:hypothetical protein ABFY09_04955 [Marinomonas sp. 5E14-1]
MLLKLYLGELGCQIVEVQNGKEVIEQYMRYSHDLDLMLVDVPIP